jgi:hypothetical protein
VLAAWLRAGGPLPDDFGDHGDRGRGPLHLCVVDASASVRRTRPDWVAWVRERLEAEARAAGEAEFAVISCASEAAFSFPRSSGPAFVEALRGGSGGGFDPRSGAGADGASRLANALELARAELGNGGTLVLLGDGRWDGADPRPLVEALRGAGVEVRLVRPPAVEVAEIGIRSLELEPELEWGAPLTAVVELFFAPGRSAPARAWLDFEVESSGGEGASAARSVEIPLDGAVEALRVAADLGPAEAGRSEVRVRARLDTGPDPVPEDDAASGATRAGGALVVAVLADVDRLDAAREWLAPAGDSQLSGLQILFRTPEDAASLLSEIDLVVSFDVPPARLPQGPLDAFVRGGGGWLASGGWRFLQAWASGRPPTRLDELLPVAPAPSEEEPRDVVLLVDGSGSMDGEPFEAVRRACRELIAFARPEDEVSLRFFTSRLEPPVVLAPRAGEGGAPGDPPRDPAGALEELFDLRVPRGDTEILTSLEALARERADAERPALVFLLSDGREREAGPDPSARIAALASALDAARARLRVVAIGASADDAFLGRLVPPGEDLDRPRDLAALEAVFRREMSGSLWREGAPLAPELVPSAADSLVAQIFPAGELRLPGLERVLRMRAKPSAEVAWQIDETSPLLVVARAGLGRVACFGSSPEANWAGAWTGRDGLGEPAEIGPLLRWLARRPARSRMGSGAAPTLTRSDRTVRLEGAHEWPASFRAELVDDELAPLEPRAELLFSLPPKLARLEGGRGALGRREALLPENAALERGARHVRFERPSGEALVLALPRVLPAEFDPRGPVLDPASLGPPTSPAARPEDPAEGARALGPAAFGLLLGFAGVLLVLRGVRGQAASASFR